MLLCHQQDYQNTRDPNHVTSQFPTDCSLCHTTAGWDDANFDHNLTQFPLTGSHVQTACASCHTNGYTGTPTDCWSCHQSNYQSTTDPNHVTENYPQDCTVCHNTTNWDDANFDHNITQFPLTGSHVQTACASCHTNGYTGTPTDCWSCHQSNYQSTTDPNHVTENYPQDCTVCHNTTTWGDASFDHNISQFPLTGSHVQTACASCHTNGYTGTPTDCWSCHQSNYQSTTDPNHVTENYPQDCTVCHNTTTWGDASFDHNITQFPLTGSHVQTACASCHTNGYTGTPTDCWSCHQSNYQSTTDPNHVTENYPQDCTVCHNTTTWGDASFDHNLSQFPLTGSHVQAACASCHTNGYTGTPTDCWSCHQSNYQSTTDPNHVTENYPQDCTVCHNTTNWNDANFDHNITQFPLTGSHVQTACASCHTNGYTGTPTDCWSCHQSNYQSTTDPNHVTENYPQDCTVCHNTTTWGDASFDHNNTQFPLTGAHTSTNCQQCHSEGYTGTPTECFACHQTDYQQSTNPNHSSIALSTTCQTCHTTNPGWAPATFPVHDSFFQLLGAHLQINDCADCHQGGNYNNTPNTCMGCHSSNYNGTNDPPHQILNFSDDCLSCHTMNGWTPATFDHSFYSVNNRHRNVNCNQCHSQANYQPQCLSCHNE